ncbi:methyl-accepting chemotaxis protein [Clostridium lundense]|uniref:methyl-accepting chemotaxis protein n=1 Tax=Clostridium lundense TaxID=319475 RepID=UPI000488657F|nr:methyl-accepting chemotaxis protein [Clostridium lundense]
MKFKNIKLKNFILLYQLANVCLILLILFLIIYFSLKPLLTNNIKSSSSQTIDALNINLNTFLSGKEAIVKDLASDEIIQAGDWKKDKHSLNYMNSWSKSIIDGGETIIMDTFIVRPDDSEYTYPHVDLPADHKPTQSSIYKDAINNVGKAIWTKPYLDSSTNKWVISCITAVKNNNKINGVVGIDVDLSQFIKTLKFNVGNSGSIYGVTKEGLYLFNKDASLIGKDCKSSMAYFNKLTKASDFIQEKINSKNYMVYYSSNERLDMFLIGEMTNELNYLNNFLLKVIIIGLIVALIIAFISSLIISNLTCKKLNIFSERFKKLSNGELNEDNISLSDNIIELAEVNNMYHNMITSFRNLVSNTSLSEVNLKENITDLKSIVNESHKAISELDNSLQNISELSNKQSIRIDNVTGLVKSINDLLNSLINNIEKATTDLDICHNELNKGSSTVNILMNKVDERSNLENSLSSAIDDIANSSKEINIISETVSQIAEQTNLLALNASIEAARAGEHGKGFTVVAEEVKKLASESSDATKKIKQLIDEIQSKSSSAVDCMKSNTEVSEAAKDYLLGTINAYTTIGTKISGINELMTGNLKVVSKVVNVKEQIVKDVDIVYSSSEEIQREIQETSTNSEEQSAAINELNEHFDMLIDLANSLRDSISKFKI